MTPSLFLDTALIPALKLLPAHMDSLEARAMVLAIGLQESKFRYREQMGQGPAHGFLQFEQGGIRGVLSHPATREHIRNILDVLCYDYKPDTSYYAVQHNDILMAAYGRLNLWWLPMPLPWRGEHDLAWAQYTDAWRPGKPHRETWDENFDEAWTLIGGQQ